MRCTVHPNDGSGHFIMVVSFARHNFRLTEENVALALEAAIGGYCYSLQVSCLRDRVFSFHVSCKEVGFFILHQHNHVCPQFKCHIHLWGHGGPDWTKEFRYWQVECNDEWILVSPSKRRESLGLAAMLHAPAKSYLHSKDGHHPRKSLRFATFLNYDACKGYRYNATAEDILTVQQDAGYNLDPQELIV